MKATTHYLNKLFTELRVSAKEFSESLGLKRPDRIYHVINGRNEVSKDLARTIQKRYPQINFDWLLTGEGEMLKNTTTAGNIISNNGSGNQAKIISGVGINEGGSGELLISTLQEKISELQKRVKDLEKDKALLTRLLEKKEFGEK